MRPVKVCGIPLWIGNIKYKVIKRRLACKRIQLKALKERVENTVKQTEGYSACMGFNCRISHYELTHYRNVLRHLFPCLTLTDGQELRACCLKEDVLTPEEVFKEASSFYSLHRGWRIVLDEDGFPKKHGWIENEL